MKKGLTLGLSFILVLLACSPSVQGAGFLIYEHGAAAMAMAGAFVAIANDPSAIFHNPAGIAWLEGTQLSLGTTLITSKASLSLPHWPDPTYATVKQESQLFYPSTFYLTHKIGSRVTAGFGFFTPYGLGTKWPKDYPLKYIAYQDDMKTFIFNPVVGIKLSESFSLGFGASYIYSTLDFKLVEYTVKDIGPLVNLPVPVWAAIEIPATFEASGSAWGVNAGALYKTDKVSVGINWRSSFKIDYDGDLALEAAQVTIYPPFDMLIPAQSVAAAIPKGGTASTAFNFPHILGFGLAFQANSRLVLAADIHYVLWSSFDKFTVEVNIPMFDDKEVEEDWKNSYVIRGGFQYQASESLALRAGVLYDQTPQPAKTMDPILPDSDRWGLTAGFGYKTGNFVLDLSYQLELFKDRTSPNREVFLHPLYGNLGEGTYSTTAHLFGISFGYKF